MTTVYDGTFRPFANTPEYLEINERCIDSWVKRIVEDGGRIADMLDLATGVGTMAEIFTEALASVNQYPILTCLDRSSEALLLAKENLGGENERTRFLEEDVVSIDLPPASMDVVVMGNSIHYLTEEEQVVLVRKVKEILRPNGYFFFNSAFFAGSIPEGTEPFYHTKVKEAARILREAGYRRVREAEKAEASNLKPIDYYRALLLGAGMKNIRVAEYPVRASLLFYEAIGSYHQYASGVLRGYPVAEAADALVEGTRIAFEKYAETGERGERFIPRNWLSVGAQA